LIHDKRSFLSCVVSRNRENLFIEEVSGVQTTPQKPNIRFFVGKLLPLNVVKSHSKKGIRSRKSRVSHQNNRQDRGRDRIQGFEF
jgi:hypothetical protein